MAFNFSSIDLKDKKTQVMILAGLLSILAIIIYVSFILVPQVDRVFKAMDHASKLGADLKVAQDNIANAPKYKSSLGLYEEKVDRYEKMLPAKQEIPALLESLSYMAKSSDVKIVGIMPVVEKEGMVKVSQIYKEIPIRISAKSGYHELGKFLSGMEGADRFMKVSDLQIKSNSQSPRQHDVEIMVLTYILLGAK